MSELVKRRVWGLPIIGFHWSLVLLLCVSFYTGHFGEFDQMDYHFLAGYGVLTLVIFRVCWGFLAKGNARFSQFVKGPRGTISYLRQGEIPTSGHNPLGALSILAILLLLLVQVGTGLFANDDIFFEGPLAHLVSYETSGQLTSIHEFNQRLLIGMIALHLIAIAYHEIIKGHRLVLPMLTGKKALDNQASYEKGQQLMLALSVLLVSCGVVYLIVNKI